MLYLISQQTPESAFGKKMALNTRRTMVRHQTSLWWPTRLGYDGRWKQSGSELRKLTAVRLQRAGDARR